MNPKNMTKTAPPPTLVAAEIAEAKKLAVTLVKPETDEFSGTKVLNSPYNTLPEFKDGPKVPAPNTKRAIVIEMLSGDGCTISSIKSFFSWKKRNTVDCLVILNRDYGYGLVTKNGITKILKSREESNSVFGS